MNVLKEVFKEFRWVGCYFHYYQNIYKKVKKLKIHPKHNISDKDLLSQLYIIPFIIDDNPKTIEELSNKYKNTNTKYVLLL